MAFSRLVLLLFFIAHKFDVTTEDSVSEDDQHCGLSDKINKMDLTLKSIKEIMLCKIANAKCSIYTNSGIADLEERISKLESLLNGKTVTGPAGVNYIRWGRNSCPSNAERLYQGYAAKGGFDQPGSGSSYVCMPEDPEWPVKNYPGLNGNSYIYGTEYWANGLDNILHHTNNHNDIPCAVCERAAKGQKLMIPAKRSCPTDWMKEYDGYLMAERTDNHHKSQSNYICVDVNFEFVSGGAQTGTPRAHAMFVEAVCGILPCPPYINGIEVACVVCTK